MFCLLKSIHQSNHLENIDVEQDVDILQFLHDLLQVLRPFLLRRLKDDVEKQMPKKYEHIVMCHLAKRQRFLYDEFMAQGK